MIKGWMIATMLVASAIEPMVGEFDFVRYALTQGGLLIVILILLWSYRKDLKEASQRDAQRAAETAERQSQRISILTELVSTNAVAMTRSASASEANEKATDRLAQVLERVVGARP